MRSSCGPNNSKVRAAVLGAKLGQMVMEAHTLKPESVHLWTDSKTTFQWITSQNDQPSDTFIRNRVYTILSCSSRGQWNWTPGNTNPADVATRVEATSDMWLSGPSFLKDDENKWPTLPDTAAAESMRICVIKPSCDSHTTLLDYTRFSSYTRARRVSGYVIRAAQLFKTNKCRTRRENSARSEIHKLPMARKLENIKHLRAEEIAEGERMMIRNVQATSFPDEVKCLAEGMPISKNSQLKPLNPVFGADNEIRLGGRISGATWVPYETRFPAILPRDCPLVKLILRHYHERFYHQNRAAVVATVRSRFWIPSVNRLMRSVCSNCQKCKNERAKPSQPIMGLLPVERLRPYVRPFTYTGVDYAGPVDVAIGRRREKRWICLFTCLTIRAIHIELATDLSTTAALMCIKNFANRRGTPYRIRSDQGTNFVGAAKVLANAEVPIEWMFNTPKNPEAGGCWERMIGLVKKILYTALEEQAPRIDTLNAILLDAEFLINSRPLTEVSVQFPDDEPLTPNHFLIGGCGMIPTPALDKVCLRGQWHIKQQITNSLWKRWCQEYIPKLVNRGKWQSNGTEVKVGDVVVFGDPSLGRGTWAKGRVTEVVTGPDQVVRSAVVQTATGKLHRPAAALAVLDVA